MAKKGSAMADKTTTDAPVEVPPTYDEAQIMFAENPGLHSVVTDKGNLTREGVLIPSIQGE